MSLTLEAGGDLTDEELVLRGKEAKRLMDDPLLVQAFTALEVAYIAAWKEAEDPAVRGTMWVKVKVLDDFKNELETYISRGVFAAEAHK